MKLEKIIFAIDNNPEYSGFWEINSEICKKNLGVTPVLFKIGDTESDFYEDDFGIVKEVKAIKGIDTGFQAQIYRMYGTKYFTNEIVMTSDIDMLLFNRNYINSQIDSISDSDLVIFNSDAYDKNRPECIGIYSGPDRYPICYVVGKGSTFNQIINTNVDFNDYCNRLLQLDLNWDTDEIYFGRCVNSQNKVKVHKLIRGYSSNFFCPNRIEKHNFYNSGIFSIDLEKKINLDSFIDCHCARPYSKFKKQIDNIKNTTLSKMNEVYLIGCHIENETQLNMIKSLTENLYKNNKDFILSSHTMIPEDIIKKSKGFIYDSENPKYKIWDLPGKTKYIIDVGEFKISSPYITHGRVDYYHVGPLRQLVNGINLIKTMDYDVIHWMDYDATLDFDEEKMNLERLISYDMVFYGVGPKFSFKVDKVNEDLLSMKNDEFLDLLSKHEYVIEKVFGDFLIKEKKLFIEVSDPSFWGNYSQNFDEVKFDWSLFELNNMVNLFIKNDDDREINFTVSVNDSETVYNSSPKVWFWVPISTPDDIKQISIKYSIDNSEQKTLLDVNMKDGNNYNNIIKSVEFINKQ